MYRSTSTSSDASLTSSNQQLADGSFSTNSGSVFSFGDEGGYLDPLLQSQQQFGNTQMGQGQMGQGQIGGNHFLRNHATTAAVGESPYRPINAHQLHNPNQQNQQNYMSGASQSQPATAAATRYQGGNGGTGGAFFMMNGESSGRQYRDHQQQQQQRRRRSGQGADAVKHRRTRSGCFTCRTRRVKVSFFLALVPGVRKGAIVGS
jgi:hypothetical protein